MSYKRLIDIFNKQGVTGWTYTATIIEWFHDPRMPQEWNEMVSSIREHKLVRQPHAENVFRIADPEEVSKPQCFKHLYQLSE